ncbi:unnamed protein product, partial [Dicrocoelium dendriticum]
MDAIQFLAPNLEDQNTEIVGYLTINQPGRSNSQRAQGPHSVKFNGSTRFANRRTTLTSRLFANVTARCNKPNTGTPLT